MKDKPKKYFCTFADFRMWRSLERILGQAKVMGVYDQILGYDEFSLANEFRIRFADKLNPSVRGFGYWVWKPQIMLQTFEKMQEGDLLHYTDVGCWLNPKGRQRLIEYFSLVEKAPSGILAFQVKNTFGDPVLDQFSLPEYKWTKGDLFDYFSVRGDDSIVRSQQIGSGNIFLRKCAAAQEMLVSWKKVFYDNFSLVDDSPSASANFEGFIEHRHDQSVFGILCKLRAVNTLSAFEYWYPSKADIKKPDWGKLERYPVWAKRDKEMNPVWRFRNLCGKVIRRLKRGRGAIS